MRAFPPSDVHLVGIGGDGMLAIAHYLADMGCQCSGSDLRSTSEIALLAARGVRIFDGHAPAHVAGARQLVVSDAIRASNPELAEARLRDLPISGRAAFLQQLAREKQAVFVAGSHGKSTTTAMIATVLESAGLLPSFILGAEAACLGDRRSRFQPGEFFVAEACEAFGNLAPLLPDFAVITNIDDDHLEHYGSQTALDRAFADLLARTRRGAVVNGDDPGVRRIDACGPDILTFGFGEANRVRASGFAQDVGGSTFDVSFEGRSARVRLSIPGRHTACNALACAALCLRLNIDLEFIAAGLATFTGVARRWADHASVGGIRIVDDYAHHPTELNVSIETALALRAPGQRLIIAHQPQLVSRTRRLTAEIAAALARCDAALLLDLDPGGEKEEPEVTSEAIAASVDAAGGRAIFFADVDDLVERAADALRPGDLLLIAGAGSIRAAAPRLIERLAAGASGDQLAPQRKLRPDLRALLGRLSWRPKPLDQMRTVVDAFRQCARMHPGQAAVVGRGVVLTYAQLDRESDAFVARLAGHGVGYGSAIGVSLPSSAELIVAILGIAKSGAVYLPIDPATPAERAQFMLEQGRGCAFVTQSGSDLDMSVRGVARIPATAFGADIRSRRGAEPRSEDNAYICFTSGSTGRPKGVAIRHESLIALMADIVPRFGFAPNARTALNTSIGFDVSLAEIWATLCGGATLCVSGASKPLVGAGLASFLADMRVTHLAVTPSVLRSMPVRALPSLACIIAAGEACSADLVGTWAPGRRFFNAYGPTETTIYATAALCRPGHEVTIGSSLRHVATWVLRNDLLPTPTGEVGELCMSGVGVARGYLDTSDTEAGGFCKIEQDGVTTPIYRTGDLVRQRADGELVFVGRRDSQVKLRGARIELEEIENTAMRLPGVLDAAACFDDRGDAQELVCFIVREHGASGPEEALRDQLAAWLPSTMLPRRIHFVDALAFTTSGKKDRKALLASHGVRRASRAAYAGPRTDTEYGLVQAWERLFPGYAPIGVYDDFFALGGDSLKSLMLIAEVETQFGLTVPAGYFGTFTTITNLAVLVDQLLWDVSPEAAAEPDSGFVGSRIYRHQRHLTASWEGERLNERSLIRSFGPHNAEYDLFVCVQYEEETRLLAEHLGADFRVHGMRSGHLVMPYTPVNVDQLSSHYIEELRDIAPAGRLLVAGICQGGAIAHAVAQKLAAKAAPELLLLVEQARFPAYGGRVAFFYSQESFLNPYTRFDSGVARLDEIYAERYTIDLITGPHGAFHRPPHVQDFVEKLRRRLADAGDGRLN